MEEPMLDLGDDLPDTDLEAQSLLLASANHDVRAVRDLLRNTSANVQDPDTGMTPLHAAVAAFEQDPDRSGEQNGTKLVNAFTNGDSAANHADEDNSEDMENAVQTVKILFQNGAIWNDLDKNNETAGCVALRLGLKQLYDLIVDAGVRAELLLSRLDEYQRLAGEEEEEEEKDDDDNDDQSAEQANAGTNPSGPEVSASVQADEQVMEPEPETSADNAAYLANSISFTDNTILDSDRSGVMMSWEEPIMKRSAAKLVPTSGLRILNVGHGMGIIDTAFQEHSPSTHHIIEAHPSVLARMREKGWYDKHGVVIHEGRWQDIVPKLVEENVLFDAIYFDTFAEDYKALREFFTEYVIGLLDPAGGNDGNGGRFGFFNGMGADRQVCYDVYNKVGPF
jgi:type IV protein arginine methyltransferase